MGIIPTRVHGVIDYLSGIVLIIAPWLLDFDDGAQAWVPMIIGASVIAYSILTDYELGIIRAIPMQAHLTLDVLGGLVLAASPWLFGFADDVWAPHVILGIAEIGVVAMTERTARRTTQQPLPRS